MLKLTGLGLLVLCCFLTGDRMAAGLTGRVHLIEGSISMLAAISDRLRYLQPSVLSLLGYLAASPGNGTLRFPARCLSLTGAGQNFPESWRQALSEQETRLGREETAILSGLSTVLGQADLDSQLSAIAWAQEQLRARLDTARVSERQYGKLYRTLGLLGGVALALVLF